MERARLLVTRLSKRRFDLADPVRVLAPPFACFADEPEVASGGLGLERLANVGQRVGERRRCLGPIAAKELADLRMSRYVELVVELQDCENKLRLAKSAANYPPHTNLPDATSKRFEQHAKELDRIYELIIKADGIYGD